MQIDWTRVGIAVTLTMALLILGVIYWRSHSNQQMTLYFVCDNGTKIYRKDGGGFTDGTHDIKRHNVRSVCSV